MAAGRTTGRRGSLLPRRRRVGGKRGDSGRHSGRDAPLSGGHFADCDSPLYVMHGSSGRLGSECLLNLNGSTCCEHRRGHNRRHVTRRRSDERPPCRCRSANRRNTAPGPAGRGSTTAPDSEQPGKRSDRPDRRSQSCQLAAHTPKLGSVGPTRGAVVQVTARKAARTDAAVVGGCQLIADLLACGVSRLESRREADPGPNQQ